MFQSLHRASARAVSRQAGADPGDFANSPNEGEFRRSAVAHFMSVPKDEATPSDGRADSSRALCRNFCGLQWVASCFGLVFFSVVGAVLADFSKQQDGTYLYDPLTIPTVVECVKAIMSFCLIIVDSSAHGAIIPYCSLRRYILFAVPALCYYVANVCMFFIIRDLGLTQYVLLSNMKIVFTIFFMRVFLRRVLLVRQWVALALLSVGVTLAQFRDEEIMRESNETRTRSYLLVVLATMASSVGGVFSEKLLKDHSTSGKRDDIHWKNVQLYSWGIVFGIFAFWQLRHGFAEQSFFHGYTKLVYVMILMLSMSGISVSFILKYTDNIVKYMATCVAIVVTTMIQILRGIEEFSATLLLSIILIILSISLYEGHAITCRPCLLRLPLNSSP